MTIDGGSLRGPTGWAGALRETATIVMPDTLLPWHRQLIARTRRKHAVALMTQGQHFKRQHGA